MLNADESVRNQWNSLVCIIKCQNIQS